MEGAARAAKRRGEAAAYQAWQTGFFSGLAHAGKLKKADHYIKSAKRSAPARHPSEMLAAMREFAARGAKMSFKRVN